MTTLNVLTSNSTRPLLVELCAAFTRASAHTVTLHSDSAKAMVARIRAGERSDAIVLGHGALEELADAGIVIASSCRPFARALVGVGVRRGTPWPDISSLQAFREALLAARSVAHTVHGASGMYMPAMFDKLGIAAQMAAKTVTRAGGYIGTVVVDGEADIALQQIPELMAVPGLDLVGPLPAPVQRVFATTAGICSASPHADVAQQLLAVFADPAHAVLFAGKGLEQA